MPRPPSTSWQKPCVVAIVAASKSASARASRSRRSRDLLARALGEQPRRPRRRCGGAPASARVEPLLGADEPLAHALAQLAGRHAREGDEQQLVERRALGDVARGERGDRVRLAGAGARLEHGDAGRQRAADVERRSPLTGRSPPRRAAGRPTAGARSGRSASARPGPSRSSVARAALGEQLVERAHAAEDELVLGLARPRWSKFQLGLPRRAAGDRVGAGAAASRRRPRSGRRAAAARASRGRRGRRSTREVRRARAVGASSGGEPRDRHARVARPSARGRSSPPRTAAPGARRSARAAAPRRRAGGAG